MEFIEGLGLSAVIFVILMIAGICLLFIKVYRKVPQGTALIVNGLRSVTVHFTGSLVYPFINKAEELDLTVKRILIERQGSDGLVCKDNMRADIKVAFFVKVNPTERDVKAVATTLGVKRASDPIALVEHFEAKFSEALKTAGKKFDFVELYEARAQFKAEVAAVIGQELDGYVLDDCAIDYLEQTDIESLSADNILDAQGIKKITELTSEQKILANQIDREREKTIKRQNVEAEEAVLEMDRQLNESQSRQKREIANIKAREDAEAYKVQEEERLKANSARIHTEEELAVAEQNKLRQVIVAEKNKERTEAIETERIHKDRMLEQTERERVVDLAKIEKERALEVERKNIQDVIRERITVEKTVVEEEEKIKDTRALSEAERTKAVAVIQAEQGAEEVRVKVVKAAQAEKESAELKAQQLVIEAEAGQRSASKNAEARKLMAEALIVEEAASGMAAVQVSEARAAAQEKEGSAKAFVVEKMASAEAKGMELKTEANKKEGTAQAEVLELKALATARGQEAAAAALEKHGSALATNQLKMFKADAQGIREKAEAMKLFDEAGRDHEEFKINTDKERVLALAGIENQRHIAAAQATVLGEALKSANIDIVGGETQFFDKMMGAITQSKVVDRLVGGSEVLSDVKNTFFTGDPEHFKQQLKGLIDQFGLNSEDIKNLTLSAAIGKMMAATNDDKTQGILSSLLSFATRLGLDGSSIDQLRK